MSGEAGADWAARLDEEIEALMDAATPETRARVAALLEGVHRFHAEGLRRLAALLGRDESLWSDALADPEISNLLLLYDLADVDETAIAAAVVGEMAGLAASRGGSIEFVSVRDGVVRVKLRGTGDAWTAALESLAAGLAAALSRRLPGFARIEATEAEVQRTGAGWVADVGEGEWVSFVPVENMLRAERRAERAREAATAPRSSGEASGAPSVIEVDLEVVGQPGPLLGVTVGDFPLLLLDVGPRIAAFRDACPGSILPLSLGSVQDGLLRCPWHGCSFDAATGGRVAGDGPDLRALRIEVDGTRAKVWPT